MRHHARIAALALTVFAVFGCNSNARTSETDSGGITLTVTNFQFGNITIPISASGNYPYVQGESVEIRSIVLNPSQPTSSLMAVELEGYEITYERVDNGTRIPPRLVERIFGTIDPGGTMTLNGINLFGVDQFNNQPLEDLLDFGRDTETNSLIVRIKVGIRFFGRTIAGNAVESQIAYFTFDFAA